MLREKRNPRGLVKDKTDSTQTKQKRAVIPFNVVQILCEAHFGNGLGKAMEAIVNNEGFERRQAIVAILVDISQTHTENLRQEPEPVRASADARKIIQATVVSLEDYREKVQFYSDIADLSSLPGTCIKELQFTAATLAFDTYVEGDAVFPKHVEVFARLFMRSADVTVSQIAKYWHCRDEQGVNKFISDKCQQVLRTDESKMIQCILQELWKNPGAYESSALVKREARQFALPAIVSELAHKRLSQLTHMGQIDFITSQPGR